MTLPPSEIERIEKKAAIFAEQSVGRTALRGNQRAFDIVNKSYRAGAQAEAVRGREMMAGVLNFAHEMDLEPVLRDNGDHQWADFSTNPTTYYTAQQIADLYILDTQKRKG